MQDLLSRLGTLDSKIDSLSLEGIARNTGFVRRTGRKIETKQWLRAVCLLAAQPTRSLRTFAWLLGLIEGTRLSKQNVGKRVHLGFESFVREVLEQLAAKLVCRTEHSDPALRSFDRVIVQDSTTIGLPAHMAGCFPGASNQTGKQIAGMRVQAFFDLRSESCLGFSIAPFTRNDQRASADILDYGRAGDLVIRDLGYSSLSVFRNMQQAGIDFISRLKYGTYIFDDKGKQVKLLSRLRKQGSVDMQVRIGTQARLPVRLIAVPVPEAVAAERRRKARANRDRRTNPSKEHMQLLGWQIIITSIPADRIGPDAVVKFYSLRWRIETLFKAWKSHFQFGSIPAYTSTTFACILVLAGLIYAAVFQCVFQALRSRNSTGQSYISPLKLASILQNLAALEITSILRDTPQNELILNTLYHCLYDRRLRLNYFQILEDVCLG